jgi:PKD repeat protein
MRLHITITLLLISIFAYSQSFDKALKTENKPLSELRHKFNPQKVTGNVDMKTPEHRTCLTPEIHKEHQQKYNLLSDDEFERELSNLKKKYIDDSKSNGIITIPVIVHVIHNGEAVGTGANISTTQVKSQIDVLNEDFRKSVETAGYNDHPDGADIEIEFALALRDEYGNDLPEAGIHRVHGNRTYWEGNAIEEVLKPQTIWNPKKYMNIWTVNFGGDQETTLGYAQFPSLSGLEGLNQNGGLNSTDGVIIGYKYFGRAGTIAAPYDGGRTTTHEIGHWLGLRHIWGDGDCSVDDFCEDTPNAGHANYSCEPINSCGLFENDMIENYMDYTPDACMNIFTQDQKERMRTVMQVCPRRKELLDSKVHLVLDKPIAFFSSDKSEVCAGETIQFMDESKNSPSSWRWTFYESSGNEVGTFTDQNPTLVFNGIGVYGLELVVGNSFGLDTVFEMNYISVLSSQTTAFPFWEDFEADAILDEWVLFNPDGDRTWDLSNKASSDGGTWSAYIDNYSEIDGDPTGNLDALFSSKLDLSANQDAYLLFDVAYARYGGDYSDTLVVYASVDCGDNFYPIWFKGGSDLATAASTQESFVPTDQQWANERIALNFLNGYADVHIAIVNWSGWGNNLYLDNINIGVPTYSSPSSSYFYTPFDTVSIGSTVGFADYSGNFPTQWNWEFEGGSPTTSTIQNEYVTYYSSGTFDVKLTTSNPSGGDAYNCTDCITVIDKPQISSTSNKVSNAICFGDSIDFEASGGLYYEWYDDRGYMISQGESLRAYPTISTYFKVTGYDRYGGFNSSIEPVTVNDQPVFDLGVDITIKENESATMDVGKNFSAYLWSDDTQNKTLTVDGSDYGVGTHEIWAIVTDENGCSATDTINFTVEPSTTVINLGKNESSISVYPIPSSKIIH